MENHSIKLDNILSEQIECLKMIHPVIDALPEDNIKGILLSLFLFSQKQVDNNMELLSFMVDELNKIHVGFEELNIQMQDAIDLTVARLRARAYRLKKQIMFDHPKMFVEAPKDNVNTVI